MPTNPFIGISTFIHLCINFIHYVFPSAYIKKVKIKKISIIKAIKSLILSFSIIVSVFIITILQAVLIVHASLADKHSSVRYLSREFTKTTTNLALQKNIFEAKIPENIYTKTLQLGINTKY